MNADGGTRNAEQEVSGQALVFFAVRNEAKHFVPPAGYDVVISGIGKQNAERALSRALELSRARMVLTCGYAGGLNPQLTLGTVVFNADEGLEVTQGLMKSGAVAGKFHCSERIIVTAADKLALREQTGADAVEMESGAIRALCRARGIASATVRVISDDANTNLPMDFNQVTGAGGNMNYLKLAGALAKSPSLVSKLKKFQRELDVCARKLADALDSALSITTRHKS